MSKMRALLVVPWALGLSADPIDIKEWPVPYGGHSRCLRCTMPGEPID